jgi:transmembrane sensor
MEKGKIIEFISGQLSVDEREKVLEWIAGSEENREEYYKLINVYALTTHLKDDETPSASEFARFRENIRQRQFSIKSDKLKSIFKYAAAIVITLLIGRYALNLRMEQDSEVLSYNEITVPPGQITQLTLSDGTSIYLNSCSSLRYPSRFGKNERTVYLSGEAFFKVAHNEKLPFLVKTSKQVLKVHGTTFNVMAYPLEDHYQATLIDGKIEILDGNSNQLSVMKPGQQFNQQNSNRHYSVNKVNTGLYTSWKDGIYMYDHNALSDIAAGLERIYAVKIEFLDKQILNYRFSGKILRNFSIEQVLKIIKLTAPVNYTIQVHEDGSKKIRLSLDKKSKLKKAEE